MEIGILTFHRASNYGAVLQAYALQRALRIIGIDNRIIDYRNETIEKSNKVFFVMSETVSIKHIAAALLNFPLRLYRRMEFEQFRKRFLVLTERMNVTDVSNINDTYDAFVVGSDQVWNHILTGNDSIYLLEGVREYRKKFSYAASFGLNQIPADLVNHYKKSLSTFCKLSVREEMGKTIIADLLNQKAFVHVDPTLLLEREEWESLCIPVRNKGKYILIYSINVNKNLIAFARNLSRKKNLPILYILLDITNIKEYRDMKYIVTPSPCRFISLIQAADTIITNSFHGTVFSIIFRKNFYVETDYGDKHNHRIESLLNQLKLTGRIIESTDVTEENTVDWDVTEALIRENRDLSLQYLRGITITT